jgi:hypothetical protein
MKLGAAYCIEKVLIEENRPMFLHEIRQAIVDKFGEWHSESAISARIRAQVKTSLQAKGIVLLHKAPKGKQAHQYWVTSPELKKQSVIKALEGIGATLCENVYVV